MDRDHGRSLKSFDLEKSPFYPAFDRKPRWQLHVEFPRTVCVLDPVPVSDKILMQMIDPRSGQESRPPDEDLS